MNKDMRTFLGEARQLGRDYFASVTRPVDPMYEPSMIQQKLAAESEFDRLHTAGPERLGASWVFADQHPLIESGAMQRNCEARKERLGTSELRSGHGLQHAHD